MNIAKGIMFKGESNRALQRPQAAWSGRSLQVWNAVAKPGEPEAFQPNARGVKCECTPCLLSDEY